MWMVKKFAQSPWGLILHSDYQWGESEKNHMTSPDLLPFQQEGRVRGITAFLWFTRLVHLSQKEENAILKPVALVTKLHAFIPRQCSGGLLCVNADGNPTESKERRGLSHHHGCKSCSLNPLHSWEQLSWRGDSSLRKSRMKYGCPVPKRDDCDLLHGHSPDCCSIENDLLPLGMSRVVQTSVTCLLTVSSEILRLDCYI